jgi:hypothetical protein
MAEKRDSQLNDIYKQQYLKSIGKDDASKKRKREEALEYLDEWIAETHQTRRAEQMFRDGESKWRQKFQEAHQQLMRESYTSGTPSQGTQEAAEKQVIEEMGTQEEYATEYVENNLAPPGLLGLIGAIRDLLE